MWQAEESRNFEPQHGHGIQVLPKYFYGDYDPSLRPSEYVCPFSDPSRAHPCTALHGKTKTKTQIAKHLLSIKRRNGDKFHPIEDPLWDAPLIVRYYLMRKPLLTEEQRTIALKSRNKRYYAMRLGRQVGAKEKLENGNLTEAEYRRLLVGKARLEFDLEKRLEKVREDAQAHIQSASSGPNVTMMAESGEKNANSRESAHQDTSLPENGGSERAQVREWHLGNFSLFGLPISHTQLMQGNPRCRLRRKTQTLHLQTIPNLL